MNYRKGKLEKMIALPEGGDKPYLSEGTTRSGFVFIEPTVGERCLVNTLSTSPVYKIIRKNKDSVLFRTRNSLYRLTYES